MLSKCLVEIVVLKVAPMYLLKICIISYTISYLTELSVFTVSSVKPYPVDNCVKMKKLWFQQSPFLKSDFRERSIKIKGTEQSKNGKLGLSENSKFIHPEISK